MKGLPEATLNLQLTIFLLKMVLTISFCILKILNNIIHTYQVKIKPCSNYNCNHNLLQYNHDILHVDVCNCSFCFVFSRASADLVLAAWAVAIVVSPRVSGKLPGVTSDNEHVETKKFAKCEETSLASLNAFKF